MLNIAKMLKPWKEAGSLNANVSLYGFWGDTATLTKSGDLMMILGAPGVDYESLDSDERKYAVWRLESALKAFGEGSTSTSTSSRAIARRSHSQVTATL